MEKTAIQLAIERIDLQISTSDSKAKTDALMECHNILASYLPIEREQIEQAYKETA